MSDSENKNTPPAIDQIIELDFDFNEVQVVSEAFFKESEDILSDLDEHILKLEAHPHDEILLHSLFRKVHTLKGSAGAVPGGQLFGSLSHEFETLLDRLRKQKIQPNKACIEIFLHSSRLLKILAENLRTHRDLYPEELSEAIELITRYGSFQLNAAPEAGSAPERPASEEIPVDEGKRLKDGVWLSKEQMSSLIQLSSDLIILKNSFQTLVTSKENQTLQAIQEKQSALSHSMNVLSDQFQNVMDKAQKVPLKEALSGLFPLVRQAAYELKKEVHFEDQGFELAVDKSLAQDLYKALVHMSRNSLDHGIEAPAQRAENGKKNQGLLKISVEEKGGVIYCEVQDDGKGLDKEKILQRALAKGLINALEAAQMSEEKIFGFIFHPGFSTKEKVTTMSGRGVGMDVVQNIVLKYGGEIQVFSKAGEGSTIQMKIPVPRTMVVERCLLADWQGYSLSFPLSEVSHISSCESLQVTEVDHLRFCQFKERTVPLLNLEEIYQLKIRVSIEDVQKMSVVFLKHEEFYVGFLVNRIQHQADLVIKDFGTLIQKIPGFKGNSVLTDEQICYVVDSSELRDLMQKESA